MAPIFGGDLYREFRYRNSWTEIFLPNAQNPAHSFINGKQGYRSKAVAEVMLRNPVLRRIETWEMHRKIRKFTLMAKEGDLTASTDQGVEYALQAIIENRSRPCDVICLKHRQGEVYYINILSLGFVAETERQVVRHLEYHLERLPAGDLKSRAIVARMRDDESRHATAAVESGGAMLPGPVRELMRWCSRVMTGTAYWV